MTTKYEVTANSITCGVFDASTEQEARDLVAQFAGYKSEADMVARLEQPSELIATEVEAWTAWVDGDKIGAVEFFAPVGGTFDIAEAGAAALGVEVSEQLNVSRV